VDDGWWTRVETDLRIAIKRVSGVNMGVFRGRVAGSNPN